MKSERLNTITRGAEKTAAAVILLLVFAFILYLTVCAYYETSLLNTDDVSGENIEFYADNIFVNIIVLTLLLSAGYLFYRHCDPLSVRRMENALMFWTFAFGTVFIATTKLRSPIYSDSFLVTYGAQRAALGDYAILGESYFYRFPFQLGYVLYSELFFRAANIVLRGMPEGYAVVALQEMNLFWLLAEYHALIEITGLLFKNARIRRLLILLMFGCLPPVLTTTFLYGNIPAFACGALAIWMFLSFMKTDRLRDGLLCALFLVMAVTLKLNLLIVCVAVGLVWLVMLLKQPGKKPLLCFLLAAVCVLTLPSLPQKIYERRVGVRYGDGIPMIAWMAMGFSEGHAAPGWYREDYTVSAFERSGYDSAATAANAKQALAERVRFFRENPAQARRFFSAKIRSQWNEPSYASLWVNQVFPSYSQKGNMYEFLCGKGAKVTLALMNQYQQFVFLGLLFGIIRLWKKKDILRCLLTLVLLGGLLYHLLFEAKSQYAMPYFVLILPIAAYGLFTLFRKVDLR